jgi:hypothetical protein
VKRKRRRYGGIVAAVGEFGGAIEILQVVDKHFHRLHVQLLLLEDRKRLLLHHHHHHHNHSIHQHPSNKCTQ